MKKFKQIADGMLELGTTLALVIGLTVVLPLNAAHASDTSSKHYGRQGALRAHDVQTGTVVMVRPVSIDNRSKANAGTAIGAAVGYGAARQVKSRDARSAARIAGGVIGGVVGGSVYNRMSRREGIEVFVRTVGKRGQLQMVSIVQDADVLVAVGDEVLLVGSGREMRVVPTVNFGSGGSLSCGPGQCGSLRGEP